MSREAMCVSEVALFSVEFEEPRVIDLWDLARSANFTEKELESFRVRTWRGLSGEAGLREEGCVEASGLRAEGLQGRVLGRKLPSSEASPVRESLLGGR